MRRVKVLLNNITATKINAWVVEIHVYPSGVYVVESVGYPTTGGGASSHLNLARDELLKAMPKNVFDGVMQNPRGGKINEWAWAERR
jgi:hypothetical protein